jgi:hypothetical protein
MDAKDIIDEINHKLRLMEEDLRIAKAIKATGDVMGRAERMRDLAVTHRSHRAALLLSVACLCELATIEIVGKNLS